MKGQMKYFFCPIIIQLADLWRIKSEAALCRHNSENCNTYANEI